MVILAVGVALLFRDQFRPSGQEPEWLSRLAAVGVGMLFVVAIIGTLTTFMECGLGECPNDGGWNWWLFS
jgi:hypothetical protein